MSIIRKFKWDKDEYVLRAYITLYKWRRLYKQFYKCARLVFLNWEQAEPIFKEYECPKDKLLVLIRKNYLHGLYCIFPHSKEYVLTH